MKPFTIKCNQCKSEDVFFYTKGNTLIIYCDHCPMAQEIKLTPSKQYNEEQSEKIQIEMF